MLYWITSAMIAMSPLYKYLVLWLDADRIIIL
jgi:hypothetical protein